MQTLTCFLVKPSRSMSDVETCGLTIVPCLDYKNFLCISKRIDSRAHLYDNMVNTLTTIENI